MIAPVLSGDGLVLAPGGTSNLSLVGRLIPQNSDEGLSAVSTLFNNFIHGKDSNIVVHGASAGPEDVRPVSLVISSHLIACLGNLAQRGHQESASRLSPS